MKNTLLFIFLLCSTLTFGQRSITTTPDYIYNIKKEGVPTFDKKGATYGYCIWVESLTISVYSTSATTPVVINVGHLLSGSFIGDYYYQVLTLMPGATYTIPVNGFLRPQESFLIQRATSETVGNISWQVSGYKISADINFNASKVIYGLGDSIASFDSGVTQYEGHMWNQAKLIVNKDLKYDARLIGVSQSGKTSTDLVNSLKTGQYRVPKADVIIFQHGVNDAYQGTSDATWNTNIQYIINWRDTFYPNAKLILVGATVLANTETTQNARLVQLRTIEATYADASKKIYYYSMASTVLPNYTPSSTYFMDAVHPAQPANLLYGADFGAYLKTILP